MYSIIRWFYFNSDFVLNTQSTSPTTNTKYYSTLNQFCSAYQAGCQTCPSQYTCTQFLPRYFWYQSTVTTNTGAFIKIMCRMSQVLCTSAATYSTCYLNFQQDSNSTVSACKCPSGYNLITSGHIQQAQITATRNITACSQCNADNTKCLACITQYQGKSYTLMNMCHLLISCSSCTLMTGSTSQTTCQVCQNGYYKTQSANDQSVLCSICSQTGAQLCKVLWKMPPSPKQQLSNVEKIITYMIYLLYNFNFKQQQLSIMSPWIYIIWKHFLNMRHKQELEILQCNSHNSGLQYNSCQNGYVIDSTNNVRVACTSGCTKCTLIAATQNTSQSISCSVCNDGNYLDNTSGRFFACPYDCKTCYSKYTCTTYKDGFYLKQSQTTFNAKQYTPKTCQSKCAICSANGNVCFDLLN
ncbi:unnamed protein product (macronuclear) [Paramecium tetraurelia]|uniref:TNFR-Cys domain-containing protein n=1 Tax=Paramecium tetraurelia TaxID=5888 RepID=A0C395_PARTE|nr:uncharacterized protein GSPATT00034740001 [Paramecium tetraurelia]CAK65262.1 unnamed protein product [Paramecium tetraurelia]|eukprot:XP_001432659.1 hypothetical protein (macronuclear) [Paramecium tetraurelia strain d4-2]